MNDQNTKKLLTDFQDLYRNRREPKEPAIKNNSFGFECDDGWFELIYNLSKKLDTLVKKFRKEECVDDFPFAFQVKEKFGTLRFYLSTHTDEMSKLITEAEKESARTCEVCGSFGVLRASGWLKTLCNLHANGIPPYKRPF